MKNLLLIIFIILSTSAQAQVTKSTLDNFLFADKTFHEITHEFDSVINAQNVINNAQAQNPGGSTQPVSYISDHLLKVYSRWHTH